MHYETLCKRLTELADELSRMLEKSRAEGVEYGACICETPERKLRLDKITKGERTRVSIPFWACCKEERLVGYIHTHPAEEIFSAGDLMMGEGLPCVLTPGKYLHCLDTDLETLDELISEISRVYRTLGEPGASTYLKRVLIRDRLKENKYGWCTEKL
jgi:hypothetical protein